MKSTTRTVWVAAWVLAGAFASSCGGDDGDGDTDSTTTTSAATSTTVAESTTSVVPTETTAAETSPPTTGSAAAPGTYIVVAGDSLFSISEDHCVTLDELIQANGWPEGIDHVIHPDDTIQLPANACAPGESTTTTTSAEASASTTETTA